MGSYHGSGDANSFRAHEYWADINYRPTNSISISIDPDYEISLSELQFVSTAGTSENPIYLFGKLEQKTMGITFRINYTINPELSD